MMEKNARREGFWDRYTCIYKNIYDTCIIIYNYYVKSKLQLDLVNKLECVIIIMKLGQYLFTLT